MSFVYCMRRGNGRPLLSLNRVVGALLSLFEFVLVARFVRELHGPLHGRTLKTVFCMKLPEGRGPLSLSRGTEKGFPLRDLRHDA